MKKTLKLVSPKYNDNDLTIYTYTINPKIILIVKSYSVTQMGDSMKRRLKGCLINPSISKVMGYGEWMASNFTQIPKGESIEINVTKLIEDDKLIIKPGKIFIKGNHGLNNCVIYPKDRKMYDIGDSW